MSKKTIHDLDLSDKRLLVCVDFNVPLREEGSIANDRRIRAALPTLRYGLKKGASLVLMTHLGRPGGEPDPKLRTQSVADRLQELLGEVPVHTSEDIAGDEAKRKADAL